MPDALALLGVHIQFFVGKTVPILAPSSVMDALVSMEVINRDQERDGFQITFSLGKKTQLDYNLLLSGILDPPGRVIIVVLFGALPQVLIDGVITNHQFVPSNTPGESRLIVTGEDISLQLDLVEKSATYPNQSDSTIVTRLFASYATYGLVPFVTPTTDVPLMVQRIPTQQGTDLAYIQRLAQRHGFVFYIEPVAPFVNKAYWGPDNRLGLPQSALTMNMGSATNIDALSFNYDALKPVTPQVTIIEPVTKTPIPLPLPRGIRPPLALRPAKSLRKTLPRDTANRNAAQATVEAIELLSDSTDAVTATGTLDGIRYGKILRARQLVGVRGVGVSYDGNYYVKHVTHSIKRGQYKQDFALTREGLGALTPVVRP